MVNKINLLMGNLKSEKKIEGSVFYTQNGK